MNQSLHNGSKVYCMLLLNLKLNLKKKKKDLIDWLAGLRGAFGFYLISSILWGNHEVRIKNKWNTFTTKGYGLYYLASCWWVLWACVISEEVVEIIRFSLKVEIYQLYQFFFYTRAWGLWDIQKSSSVCRLHPESTVLNSSYCVCISK